uniref:Uncharacterized protein n=1 Tax=Oryza barthii TaxID=65489 RepID=A0A2I4S682_9ORYZ|nr:hypothetical protein BAR_21 [Oryza barthii]
MAAPSHATAAVVAHAGASIGTWWLFSYHHSGARGRIRATTTMFAGGFGNGSALRDGSNDNSCGVARGRIQRRSVALLRSPRRCSRVDS